MRSVWVISFVGAMGLATSASAQQVDESTRQQIEKLNAGFGMAYEKQDAAGIAATTRVFVAGQGSDSNPCTFAAPCRTFNRAASVVAAGGAIDVLDPAEYGSVSITKSLSIRAMA